MALPSWGRARQQLVIAALLDASGLIGLLAFFAHTQSDAESLLRQKSLMATFVFSYCSFGWLFGSYTLLKLPHIRWSQAILRLSATCAATILLSAFLDWGSGTSEQISITHRNIAIPIIALTGAWSATLRLLLRKIARKIGATRWLLIAKQYELEDLKLEWDRALPARRRPRRIELHPLSLHIGQPPQDPSRALKQIQRRLKRVHGAAISSSIAADPQFQDAWEKIADQTPPILTLVELAEKELERIPPQWVDGEWKIFSRHVEGQQSSPNQQLKRYADVILSITLLILSVPLLAASAFAIYLQDRGPVLYRQRRTGLLGHPFEVLKFRTMVTNAEQKGAQWSHENDDRITRVGKWLRKMRIDELPQLVNVLRGEMSLIGPRPERPELEAELESSIPHYRLRHWIRPGLSGWAQVNMPYGASIEDAQLKLSYDLYYLRNSSPWLDALILAKTIKTVLKASGR